MKRRDFIAGLGAAGWPLLVRAQQQTKPVIGWLGPATVARLMEAEFRRGLAEVGFSQARDIKIEQRTVDGIADLLRQRPAAIVAASGYEALAAKVATRDIPIIFVAGYDPVELGLVASLNRPGGNLTGVFTPQSETAEKRLQLLHEAVPAAETIALFVGPVDPIDTPFTRANPSLAPAQWLDPIETRHTQSAARTLGLRLLVFNVTIDTDPTPALATLVEHQAGGIVVGGNISLIPKYTQILSHAARFALPTMFVYSGAARAGGLLSYGQDTSGIARQMGAYTGRILKRKAG
jgi:putative tryptophan/tyrosine transport system substrate-binding protein